MKNICITVTLLMTTAILGRAQGNTMAVNQAEKTATETLDRAARVAMTMPYEAFNSALGHQLMTGIAELAKSTHEGRQAGSEAEAVEYATMLKNIQSLCKEF